MLAQVLITCQYIKMRITKVRIILVTVTLGNTRLNTARGTDELEEHQVLYKTEAQDLRG